jgi:hypothetical protein
MGSTAGGVILAQLLYWSAQVDGRKFAKTDEELQNGNAGLGPGITARKT